MSLTLMLMFWVWGILKVIVIQQSPDWKFVLGNLVVGPVGCIIYILTMEKTDEQRRERPEEGTRIC